jgi:hypothetical protein
MKTILPLIAALFLSCGLALAADSDAKKADTAAAKQLTSSQQRMVDCNKEATGKKGMERRDFMRQCLHGGGGKPASAAATPAPAAPAADAKVTQQSKMKDCNKQAGEKALKGPERKAFMKECLKAK